MKKRIIIVITFLLVCVFAFITLGVNNSLYALTSDEEIYHIVTTVAQDNTNSVTVNYHAKETGSYVLYTVASDTEFKSAQKAMPNEELWSTEGIAKTKEETTFYTRPRYVCNVTLENLSSRTKYIYKIVSGDAVSKVNSFTTSGLTNTWTFAAFSDFQYRNNSITHELIKNMKDLGGNPNLMICSGDMVDVAGSESEWDWLLDNDEFSNFTFACSPGDHEYWADDKGGKYPQYDYAYTYNKLFKNPSNGCETSPNTTYYFYYNNVLFVSLDMNNSDVSSGKRFTDEVAWFKSTLDSLKGTYQYLVVYEHKSIFGSEKEDSSVAKNLRPQWYPVFQTYNVDLVISGHDHMYSRTKRLDGNKVSTSSKVGTFYLDMGSSGDKRRVPDTSLTESKLHEKVMDLNKLGYSCSTLVNVSEEEMQVVVYNQYKKVVDGFTIPAKRSAQAIDASEFDANQFKKELSLKMTNITKAIGEINLESSNQGRFVQNIKISLNDGTELYNKPYSNSGIDAYLVRNLSGNSVNVNVTLVDGTEKEFKLYVDFTNNDDIKYTYSPYALYFKNEAAYELLRDESITLDVYVGDEKIYEALELSENSIPLENKYLETDNDVRIMVYSNNLGVKEEIGSYQLTVNKIKDFTLPEEEIVVNLNYMVSFSIIYEYKDLIECECELIQYNKDGGNIVGIKAGEGLATFTIKGTSISHTINVTVVGPSTPEKKGCNSASGLIAILPYLMIAGFVLLKKKETMF